MFWAKRIVTITSLVALVGAASCQVIGGLTDLAPGGAGGSAGAGGAGGGDACPAPGDEQPCMNGMCLGTCRGMTCDVDCQPPVGGAGGTGGTIGLGGGPPDPCNDPMGNVSCGAPELKADCEITCNGEGACVGEKIVCPDSERPCTVKCVGENACAGKEIDCGTTAACIVICEAGGCVGATVECGAGRCEVNCNGMPGTEPPPFAAGIDGSCHHIINNCKPPAQ